MNFSIKPPAPSRRLFLQRSALTIALGGIGYGALQGNWLSVFAQTAPAADGYAGFLHLSRYLTGKTTLDEELGRALYAALSAADPTFDTQVQALGKQLKDSGVAASELQHTLDAAKSPVAALPKQIMAGWYLGVVGKGINARAVAFEQALMYPPVADVIVLNTYAHGVPGYWATPPQLPHA